MPFYELAGFGENLILYIFICINIKTKKKFISY